MKLCSVLFFLVLGLTAYDYTTSMPVELVDLEHMKTTIVDSSKAAEIIDNKESDDEDDSSDAENGDEPEEDDSQKKEYVPETPDVSAVATEGEESPTKKESVLDSKKEESHEATVAKDCIDGLGKRHYGWGGCGGGGYGGYGGGYGGYGGGYGGYGGHGGGFGGHGGGYGGYGGYGGHGHGGHGHHEHGHDNHDHGYEFYEEYDDHHGGHHGGHEGGHGGHGYGGYGGGYGDGGHGHGHEGHEHGHHGHHAGYHREWNYNHAGEHGGYGGGHHSGCGGYGCHGGYKKEQIKASNSNKNEKAKTDSKKSKEAGATKDKKAGKDAAKAATKDAAKAAEIANTQAVPKPGQQTQQLNWGNVQLAASGKPSTPAVNPSEVVDKSQGGGVKNWWKVGDGCVHWGHDHWGTPHHLHPCGGGWEYGHTGMKHGHGHFRDEVPDCNDPETATTNKRCLHGGFGHHAGYGGYGVAGGYSGGHHGDGYHFVDHGSHHGHEGHHEHDFHLRGPWTFGYDDFGDDWGDWDHNYNNLHHLEHLEHPHDHAGYGKADVPTAADKKYHLVPIEPFYGGWGFPAGGYGYGLGRGYGYGYGIGPGVGYWPSSYGLGIRHHGFGHHGVLNHFPLGGCIGGLYRDVIHKGSKKPTRRCLFGRIGHPLGGWYGWGSWPWGGYGDFVGHGSFGGDVGGGLYGNYYGMIPLLRGGRGFLFGKGAIPKGVKEDSASSRQGVVYPYVGYGPWASYPWWGDWWGGHGHHGWGSFGHGAHHGGLGYGHRGGYGHGVGLHCRDIVPNDDDDNNESKGRSKRFCVPIGYHGGYGWPFWHGYPGAGLGMYGWGWPWYKSKVPKGEKGASSEPKKAEKSNEKDGKKASKDLKSTQRDEIPGPDQKQEKKQTIHVGYGYASGDNYRLGYGMGGMGGVSGFSGQGIGGDETHAQATVKKSIMPSQKENSPLPENVKEVTATKRQFQEDCSENGQSRCTLTDSHPTQEYGHPVTHPGFTTIGTPGIAVISKNLIPKATEKAKPAKRDFDGSQISGSSGYGGPSSFAQPVTQPGFTTVAWPGHALTTNDAKNRIPKVTAKVKRQIFGPQEGFSGMIPMQDQVPDQPFPQEQGPEMMGPSRFSDQPSAAMMPAPSNGYPGFQRAFIPMAPRPIFAPELLNNDDSLPY